MSGEVLIVLHHLFVFYAHFSNDVQGIAVIYTGSGESSRLEILDDFSELLKRYLGVLLLNVGDILGNLPESSRNLPV